VNALLELLDAITTIMLGAESGSRVGRIGRASDIDPFILRLEEMGAMEGIERCGDESLCHGETVLVYAVEPLITPEGKGLADVAVRSSKRTAPGSTGLSSRTNTCCPRQVRSRRDGSRRGSWRLAVRSF
jgi:hypothetical protein